MCGFFIHYPLNEKNSFDKKKFLKSGNFIFIVDLTMSEIP